MRKHASLVLGVLALASFGHGCGPRGGTDVGNGVTATFDLGAYENDTANEVDPLLLDHGVRIEQLWISVGRFRLSRNGSCSSADGPDKLALDGPLIADLTREDSAPGTSEEVFVDEAAYCRLRARLVPVDPSDLPEGAPAELGGAALLVVGTRADGVAFTVRSSSNVMLSLDTAQDHPFELAGREGLMIAFDAQAAANALDLDDLEVVDGVIIVDQRTNASKLAAFENALRKTAKLFRDEDADGLLSPTESAVDKALAREAGASDDP